MNYIKPYISNDISSPCNKNNCSSEAIASCCGCSEWFAWKAGIDKGKVDYKYAGKHLNKEDK